MLTQKNGVTRSARRRNRQKMPIVGMRLRRSTYSPVEPARELQKAGGGDRGDHGFRFERRAADPYARYATALEDELLDGRGQQDPTAPCLEVSAQALEHQVAAALEVAQILTPGRGPRTRQAHHPRPDPGRADPGGMLCELEAQQGLPDHAVSLVAEQPSQPLGRRLRGQRVLVHALRQLQGQARPHTVVNGERPEAQQIDGREERVEPRRRRSRPCGSCASAACARAPARPWCRSGGRRPCR